MLAFGLFLVVIGATALFLAYLAGGPPPPLRPNVDEKGKQLADVYNAQAARLHPWLGVTGLVFCIMGVMLVAVRLTAG